MTKAIKAPVPTEHDEQKALVKWFDLQFPVMRGRLAAVPNGGDRHPIVAAKLKAEGVRKGYPDLQLLAPRQGYHGLLIELKRKKGGRVEPEQADWLDWLNQQGYMAIVCRGADEAREAIKGYLGGGMIYTNALSAVVSALAAECIDNTSKQKWQQLYDSGELRPAGNGVSPMDRMTADCWVFARLHHGLKGRHWDALVAKYSTHKARKVEAIGHLAPLIASHAPALFVYKAVTAWAIPQLKGQEGKRSADMIVLPASFYDLNLWDVDANSERTRHRWKKAISDTLADMVNEAMAAAEAILQAEGVLMQKAA